MYTPELDKFFITFYYTHLDMVDRIERIDIDNMLQFNLITKEGYDELVKLLPPPVAS